MSDQPPAKRRKIDLSESFTVLVGSEEKSFYVQTHYLTKSSKFFQKVCNGTFKEGLAKVVKLPEQDPATFSIYLQWLFTGDLVITDKDIPSEDADYETRNRYAGEVSSPLIESYIMGDALMDARFCNVVLDELIEHFATIRFLSCDAINTIYASTLPSAKIRGMLVDLFIICDNPEFLEKVASHLDAKFVADVAVQSMRAHGKDGKPLRNPYTAPKCTYHDHDEENPKCE